MLIFEWYENCGIDLLRHAGQCIYFVTSMKIARKNTQRPPKPYQAFATASSRCTIGSMLQSGTTEETSVLLLRCVREIKRTNRDRCRPSVVGIPQGPDAQRLLQCWQRNVLPGDERHCAGCTVHQEAVVFKATLH